MSGFHYPPLELDTLLALDVVKELIETYPDYFFESPYPATTEKLLKKWFAKPEQQDPPKELTNPKRPGRPTKEAAAMKEALTKAHESYQESNPDDTGHEIKEEDLPMFEGLRQELVSAYRFLKSAKHLKGQDRVDYAKQSVALLEKMVKMEQAVTNVELVGQFQNTVLTILDEICDQAQRSQFMAKLKPYLTPDMQEVAESIKDEKVEETD